MILTIYPLAVFSLAFSSPLEPLVFLDNDLLSFRYFFICFFSGFGASIFLAPRDVTCNVPTANS